MKAFKIMSSGWEIYGQHTFLHDNKTDTEFTKDCRSVLKEALKEVTDNLEERSSQAFLSANSLMDLAIPKLENMGYKSLEFEGIYSVPGDDGAYFSSCQSQQELVDELGEELVNDFVYKAKIIDDRD